MLITVQSSSILMVRIVCSVSHHVYNAALLSHVNHVPLPSCFLTITVYKNAQQATLTPRMSALTVIQNVLLAVIHLTSAVLAGLGFNYLMVSAFKAVQVELLARKGLA